MQKIKAIFESSFFKHLTDVRNIGLYIFLAITLMITWSGVKTIQSNYQLQKKINQLKQENEVAQLERDNLALKNEYLKTDQFLELAARRQFGLAAPGEKVYVVPKEVALKYAGVPAAPKTETIKPAITGDQKNGISQNLSDWRDFLLGKTKQ